MRYAWIAYGSQGRQELTLHSDQDNALILADEFRHPDQAEYFAQLARAVCDGLAACGFVHCPGDMMATNPDWRRTPTSWRDLFSDWITHTDPQKARLACNLFDFRVIHGDADLARPLRDTISRESPRHESLLAHLVANRCTKAPPLGLFRQFVVVSEGAHEGELDIKRHGILPIVDLARIHALAAGVGEVGTLARLRAAAGSALLSHEGAETLEAAFNFLLGLRTRHQTQQLLHGLPPDNFIAPATLTATNRQQLRDAFLAIDRQQKALLLAYPHTLTP
jgi:CBS domain-containing protein